MFLVRRAVRGHFVFITRKMDKPADITINFVVRTCKCSTLPSCFSRMSIRSMVEFEVRLALLERFFNCTLDYVKTIGQMIVSILHSFAQKPIQLEERILNR